MTMPNHHGKNHTIPAPGHRRSRAWIVVLAALWTLWGCGPRDETLRIGLLIDSGVHIGQPTAQAARLVEREVEARGGVEIGGRRYPLELIVAETNNSPEDAVAAAQRLINVEGVLALVGPSISRSAIPVARLAERAGVVMVSPASTRDELTVDKEFVFRVTYTDSTQLEALARFVVGTPEISRLAVLYDVTDVYSRRNAEEFRALLASTDLEITAFEPYTAGETDFSEHLRRIAQTEPDTLFLPNYSDDVIAQANQARAMGLGVTFVGSDGWTPQRLEGIKSLEGAYLSKSWSLDWGRTQVRSRAFIETYEALDGREPHNVSALTYDAFGVLFWALGKAGTLDAVKVRDQLQGLEDYGGVSGTFSYRGTGGNPRRPVTILRLGDGTKPEFHRLIEP